MTEHGSEGGQPSDSKDAKAAWSEAGDRLSVLGSRLKQHYERQSGTSGGPARDEVKDAARRLGEAVQTAFDAIGAAAKDPEVKDDVRQVGRSVSDALTGTLTGLSDELRKTFGRQDAPPAAGQASQPPATWPTDDPDAPPPPTYGTPPATSPGPPAQAPTAEPPVHGTPEGTPPGASPDTP